MELIRELCSLEPAPTMARDGLDRLRRVEGEGNAALGLGAAVAGQDELRVKVTK